MTIFFRNHEITIYRRRRIGSANRYALSATFTAYSADIQPANQERVEFVSGRIGAVFTAFVDSSVDVKEGDQIRVLGGSYDGKVFSVRGVSHWEGAGLLDHTELVLTSLDG